MLNGPFLSDLGMAKKVWLRACEVVKCESLPALLKTGSCAMQTNTFCFTEAPGATQEAAEDRGDLCRRRHREDVAGEEDLE